MGWRKVALAVAAATLAVLGTAAYAALRAGPPARCAPGMVALGPRCCGEGQTLDGSRCVGKPSSCAAGLLASEAGCTPPAARVSIAGGRLDLDPHDWEAVGVTTARTIVAQPFEVDAFEVSEARYAACAADGGCAPLEGSGEPGRPITHVTREEAARYCAWAGGALPTLDQLVFAASGTDGRRYPWGLTGAVCRRAVWGLRAGPCGHGATGPDVVGSRPDGRTPEGVADLSGNVAEWTATPGPSRGPSADPSPGPSAGRSGAHEDAVVFGGSFADERAAALRSWFERPLPVDHRGEDVGFRCVYAAP